MPNCGPLKENQSSIKPETNMKLFLLSSNHWSASPSTKHTNYFFTGIILILGGKGADYADVCCHLRNWIRQCPVKELVIREGTSGPLIGCAPQKSAQGAPDPPKRNLSEHPPAMHPRTWSIISPKVIMVLGLSSK